MPISILDQHSAPSLLSTSALDRRTVGVLGFGNQGAAHALNLRDSGVAVVVGNRSGTPNARAAADAGFEPMSISDCVKAVDLCVVALPDDVQPKVFTAEIEPHLQPGQTLGFLHGFSIHYGFVKPPPNVGVVLVAPKGPGTTLRQTFVDGTGIPCLFAVEQDTPDQQAEAIGLAWATGIGCARSGVIRTSFRDEAITDLFGEQAVLCGGMMTLVRLAFETLVAQGFEPELAYLECCHELKQVADLLYARGPSGMNEAISSTAEFGSLHAFEMLDTPNLRGVLSELLKQVISGRFANDVQADLEAGSPRLSAARASLAHHPIESAGRTIRSLMPWLSEPVHLETPDSAGSP